MSEDQVMAAAIEQDKLVRMEIHRGWIQVQELEKQLGLLPMTSFLVLHADDDHHDSKVQIRSALVDKVTRIISIFSNVVACLHTSRSNNITTTSSEKHVKSDVVVVGIQEHGLTPETCGTLVTSDCSTHSDQESSPKKRKASANPTKITTTTSVVDPKTEACPDDDGHSWRKYGQKEILGSRFPKSYYRCTHKRESGCPAIKYVQRSDKDPSIFHVTYKGEHNCHLTTSIRKQQQIPPPSSSPPYYHVQMNSACLRMNSDGGLTLGPTGPKLSPITLPSPLSRCASEEVVAEHTPFDLDFILESDSTLFNIDDASLFGTEHLPCLLT